MAENKLVKCNWLYLNVWKILIYLVICPMPWWIARNTIALENSNLLCYVSKVDHELHEHSRGRECQSCTDYCSWNHALEIRLFLLIQDDETNPLLDQTLPKYYDHRTEEIILLFVWQFTTSPWTWLRIGFQSFCVARFIQPSELVQEPYSQFTSSLQ